MTNDTVSRIAVMQYRTASILIFLNGYHIAIKKMILKRKSNTLDHLLVLMQSDFSIKIQVPHQLHLKQPRIYGHDNSTDAHENGSSRRAKIYSVAVQDSCRQGNGYGIVARCP